MPESRYNPVNKDIARKTSLMEEVLISTRNALAHFIISLSAPEQIYMVQEAILPCLKNLDTIKAVFAANNIGNAGDQDDEEETKTIVNAGDNGGQEVPQDGENNSHNKEGDNPVPSPPPSPRNLLISSKFVKIEGKSYQIRK